MTPRPRAWLLALAIFLGAPPPAGAQLGEDSALVAQEQFREGRDAFKAGDYQRALEFFKKSHELYPATGTLLNLALCEAQLGQITAAHQHFKEVIPQLAARDERLAVAKKELAALEARAPKLRIHLETGATMADVTLDGSPVSPERLGTDMLVDPGRHVVQVSAPGREPRRYAITLEEGSRTVLAASLGAAESAVPKAPPKEADRPGSTQRIAGFVVGGLGVVGLGVAAVTGVMALDRKSEVDELCPDPSRCTAEGVAIAHSGRTLSVVSTVGLVAGAVGVGVGVILLLTGGDDGNDQGEAQSEARRAPRTRVVVGATPLPGGGAFSLRGTF